MDRTEKGNVSMELETGVRPRNASSHHEAGRSKNGQETPAQQKPANI